jgi:4-hydroxybenzoate polyprenyltransferase
VSGPLGLLHPFPSALDAAAAGAIAALAGAGPVTVVAVAAAMALLQTSIGAANDLVDVDHDRVARPGKPIPSGRVTRRTALAYAVAAGVLGLGLSFVLGPLAAVVAATGYAAGLAYDAWLSRTALSWLPFAVGLPLLPAFSWAAARGHLPAALPGLAILGALAGAAVALSNGLVDVEGDQAAGGLGLAAQLGRPRAEALLLLVDAALVALVGATAAVAAASGPVIGVLAVGALLLGGAAVAARSSRPGRRERAWEAEAIGLVLLAVAWLACAEPGILR